MLEKSVIKHLGNELYEALKNQTPVEPLTTRYPQIGEDDAYKISLQMLNRRIESGEKVVGKKIGVTSAAVMEMLNVHQPDYGYLTNVMMHSTGVELDISAGMIAPRAEGEVAFVLKKRLLGPGISNADVISATDFVMPCFEIVDSRIANWEIKIEDTIADNASCGAVILGNGAVDLQDIDLATCGIVVSLNGELISTGAGAAAMGSPINCVTWLANTLGSIGIPLEAGEVILSGSLLPRQPVQSGDSIEMRIGGLGSCTARFL
jgi:2-oxopent-4-enoate/cis-2-oxohex-4-enoate hydratase